MTTKYHNARILSIQHLPEQDKLLVRFADYDDWEIDSVVLSAKYPVSCNRIPPGRPAGQNRRRIPRVVLLSAQRRRMADFPFVAAGRVGRHYRVRHFGLMDTGAAANIKNSKVARGNMA